MGEILADIKKSDLPATKPRMPDRKNDTVVPNLSKPQWEQTHQISLLMNHMVMGEPRDAGYGDTLGIRLSRVKGKETGVMMIKHGSSNINERRSWILADNYSDRNLSPIPTL